MRVLVDPRGFLVPNLAARGLTRELVPRVRVQRHRVRLLRLCEAPIASSHAAHHVRPLAPPQQRLVTRPCSHHTSHIIYHISLTHTLTHSHTHRQGRKWACATARKSTGSPAPPTTQSAPGALRTVASASRVRGSKHKRWRRQCNNCALSCQRRVI
jgi:hypothetical protein